MSAALKLAARPLEKIGSRVANYGDSRWEALYDTITIPAGAMTATPMRFFSIAIGGAKSKVHTNMTQSGILPKPQTMKVYGLHAEAYVNDPADVNALVELSQKAVLRFFIGTKDYLEQPLSAVTGGIYLAQAPAASTALMACFGAPKSVGYRYPKDGFVEITESESFGVEIVNYSTFTLHAALDLRMFLDGIRKVDVR